MMASGLGFASRPDEVLVEPLDDVAAFELGLPIDDEAGDLGLSRQLGQPVLCAVGLVDLHERDPILQSVLFNEVADAGGVGAGPFVNEFELQSLFLSYSIIWRICGVGAA